MSKDKEEKILSDAKSWLYSRINPRDIGYHDIQWEKGLVTFSKSKFGFIDSDILKAVNASSGVRVAWWHDKDMLRLVTMTNDIVNISRSDIWRKDWFCTVIKNMIMCGEISQELIVEKFATYNPIFVYHSNLDFDILESVSGKDFDFERKFKKPKNRIYATIEI